MLRIDGRDLEADDDKTLLEAAKDAGIIIPTLCHHPALTPIGACRLCSVEIERNSRIKVVTSCNYPVEAGLVVKTSSPEIFSLRSMILELLLARSPGEARIAALAKEYGVSTPRFKLADESCILCGLCTRVCQELVGVSAMSPILRGVERAVDAAYRDFSEDCMACGACALVCPTAAIREMEHIYPLTPEETEEIESRLLSGEIDEDMGVCADVFGCRGHGEGQDGGAVTTILASAIEMGSIDAAVVVMPGDDYRAYAAIVDDHDGVMASAGTKYVRVPLIPKLLLALGSGKRRIAVVGTPCQIRSVRRLQAGGYLGGTFPDAEIVLVGLFCFESFDPARLKRHIRDAFSIDLDEAERVQIAKGRFSIFIGDEVRSCKVSDLDGDISEGCLFCADFVSRLADISVGSVGSPEGYSTVIVRSDRGRRLLEGMDCSRERVDEGEIRKLSAIKRRRAEKRFKEIIDGLEG
ncbi:Coenzyme F420 hydrogenase/dehydrogenase, beta subunit C-terminal domain [Methanotrichaceae archaeon Mx]|uniref:Coenzyme F420 hydrogenase/dehydrogenase, beta subunit C-terminal domain n=2 Tax=Candidatus Methanocrinis natronophilus TaxID=3033396 RepID=A0ABT5X6Q7_9EURY|nr:Coenzyme F420 hydrogenase/dehydrogenase, beta subunit C-terminal domain [Candidatus Methanocrinis natronophilus]